MERLRHIHFGFANGQNTQFGLVSITFTPLKTFVGDNSIIRISNERKQKEGGHKKPLNRKSHRNWLAGLKTEASLVVVKWL